VEDGIANLCFLLPRAVVARLGPHWPAMQGHLMAANTNLAERLTGAEPLLDRAVAVVCPAGGHLHDEHEESEFAVYRVGDRLAHIPPFTGDGLAIALGSAALAVEYIRRERAPAAYLAAARRLTGKPIRLASARGSRTATEGISGASCGRRRAMGARWSWTADTCFQGLRPNQVGAIFASLTSQLRLAPEP
jgi:hypothetical protein